MSALNRVPNESQQRQRTILRYDLDVFNRTVLFRIDLIVSPPPFTPVTASYEARLDRLGAIGRAIPARAFDPREVECCFEPNGRIRTVYIPYKPNTTEHKQHIRELKSLLDINFNGLATLTYISEGTR